MLKSLLKDNFIWFPLQGMGYYPVRKKALVYNKEYFNKYIEYSKTELGKRITNTRIDFVKEYHNGVLLDIGIGCGDFVTKRKNTLGFDVNIEGVQWLVKNGFYADPYVSKFEAMSFWDSFEHIEDPAGIVKQVDKYVFLSLPIFTDETHILKSKHFRKDEHYWYFTNLGLTEWFFNQGFVLRGFNRNESLLGREDIQSFVFERFKR